MPVIRTFAPLLFPVNFISELSLSNSHRFLLLDKVLCNAPFNIKHRAIDWSFGYGSLEHDAIPVFFQQSAVIEFAADDCPVSNLANVSTPTSISLHLFDDVMSVLCVDLEVGQSFSDHKHDSAISDFVQRIASHVVQPLSEWLIDNIPQDQDGLLAPANYYNYKHYSIELLKHTKPLWVARMALLDDNTPQHDLQNWNNWSGYSVRHDRFLVGSGNSVVHGDAACWQDATRSMMLCQFYSALQWQFEEIFMQQLGRFDIRINHASRMRHSLKIASLLESQIDHLEFVNLQFSSALYGMQKQRRSFNELIINAWQINEQKQRIIDIAGMLSRRIERLSSERSVQNNRIIQRLLGVIGGLSVIDLTMGLSDYSQNLRHDNAGGLLDLILQIPSDHMLTAAIFIVVLITFLMIRFQK